jgi:hypothetical protein
MSILRKFNSSVAALSAMMLVATLLAACGKGSATAPASSTDNNTPVNTTPVIPGLNQTGTGSAALTSIPSATGNSVAITVDAGIAPGSSSVNVGYVSVTVCTPGTSGSLAACQTIDHVSLDTGSYGLRLLNSTLSSSLTLPAVVAANGQAIGECVPFVIGTTWGSVRLADIYIGGEVARNVPIQDIGDNPGGVISIPADCSSKGKIQNTLAELGSNGILGVGPFKNDCDACLVQVIPATYYTCTASGCTNSTVTAAQVVRNPVASFAVNNNGVLVNLPAVSAAGSTGLNGSLIFGIGTQSNNALNNAVIYATDSSGNFTTTYNGTKRKSYLDSGSNGLFFNDSSIPTCTSINTWAYCPSATIFLSATNNAAVGGTGNPVSQPTPTIVHANNLFLSTNIVAGNIGGPYGVANTFAWGLPFFYGRPVYTAIAGVSVTGIPAGPYWAY